MENQNSNGVGPNAMEGDKRTHDFTTLLLLSLKRRLYDKLRQSCFRLTQRPNKNWSPKKRLFAEEENGERSDLSADSFLIDRTNSRPEVFYSGDGRWFSTDWTSVGVTSSPKRQNSTVHSNLSPSCRNCGWFKVLERRRRVNASLQGPLEYYDQHGTRLSSSKLIHRVLPWFFPWILTIFAFLFASQPKTQDTTRTLSLLLASGNCALGPRKNKSRVGRLQSSRTSPVNPRQRGRDQVYVAQTKGNASALAVVSKSKINYQKLKETSSQGGSSRNRTTAQSPSNRQSLAYISPHQRLIMAPISSPRTNASQHVYSSPSFEEDRHSQTPVMYTDDALLIPSEGLRERDLHSSPLHQTQDTRLESSRSGRIADEGDTAHPEGLLSLHFSRKLSGEVHLDAGEVSTSNNDGFCHNEDEDVESLRLVRSCSGRWTGDEGSRVRKSKPLERSSKSLPKNTTKTRALQALQTKKAAARRHSRPSVDHSLEDGIMQEGTSPMGLSSSANAYGFPEGHPMWRLQSTSSYEDSFDDLRMDSFETDRSRRMESQASVDSTSSIGFDLEGATSVQTSNLIRINTREILRGGSGDSSMYRWPTISERDSALTNEGNMNLDPGRITEGDEEQSNDEESPEEHKSISSVQITDSAPVYMEQRRGASPFSSDVRQRSPFPQKHRTSRKTRPKEREGSGESFEGKVVSTNVVKTAPKQTKKPPPPPPPTRKSTDEDPRNAAKTAPLKGKGPAPPPPPPMSRGKSGRGGNGISRQPEVIAMFQAVSKGSKGRSKSKHKRRSSRHDSSESNSKLVSEGSGGDALIKELEQNSGYFAQIQNDVETYGPEIQQIINDMAKIRFQSMTEMNAYVCEVDALLEKFADETAVLKQFEWPGRYYIYREALALWLEIQKRNEKCRNWVQGTRGMSAELQKMRKYMEQNIKRLDDIQRTLDTDVRKFKANGIPWDPTIIPKLHQGTMLLLQTYMQIICDQVSKTHGKTSHRESNIKYLKETIRLAFKIHQFAGGFTQSCTALFDKIATLTKTLDTDL